MDERDLDKLLGQDLGGDSPEEAFRARVLQDSTAAFLLARRSYTRWRLAALSAPAVFIAAVSFLLGRCSVVPSEAPLRVPLVAAGASETVAVPGELVAWLDAARLFRQLGMEERMARAVDRAGRLLPADAVTACDATGQAFATDRGAVESGSRPVNPGDVPAVLQSVESVNRMMAQSCGD